MKEVRIDVFDGEQYCGDWPTREYPTKLAEAIAWFQRKLEEVPAEFRRSAECEIASTGGYEDSHTGEIRIWYYRPETKAETQRRLAEQTAKVDRERAEELAMLKALQSKYPEAAS